MSSDTSDQRSAERTPLRSRPAVGGYGIHQDEAGMLPWTWASERLSAAHNYWMCTTRPDGRPHATPVWGVWLDETFYCGTDARSRKARNLAANPHVVVHLESGDDAVILEGVAVPVYDLPRELYERIAAGYAAKYDGFRPDPDDISYALRPQVAFAWQERDFPTSATRWRFSHG